MTVYTHALGARAVRIDEDDTEAARIGAKLAEVLKLRRDPADRSRWLTTWGNRTDAGLARTVLRLLSEETP